MTGKVTRYSAKFKAKVAREALRRVWITWVVWHHGPCCPGGGPGYRRPNEVDVRSGEAAGTKLGGWRGGPMVNGTLGSEAVRKSADALAAGLASTLHKMQSKGLSLRQTAGSLGMGSVNTLRGGAWSAAAVRNALARIE